MRKLFLLIWCIAGFLYMNAGNLDGTWTGNLEVTPQVSLKIVFNISDSGMETQSITLDSPDQNAYGIPTEINFLNNDSLALKVPQLVLTYEGKLCCDTIRGTFKQGPMTLPLNLVRGKPQGWNRPQTPTDTLDYLTEEVSFAGGEEGVTLAGTLTMPKNNGEKVPIVVMVSGSGAQNRDEELFGHKPFAVIADRLAREGIASLRYDDRGAFESTGDVHSVTTKSNADDARAAIDFVRKKGSFSKTGLLGHSEGGTVAFMLGGEKTGPDFIITMGAPTVRGDSILRFQNRHLMEKGGMPDSIINDYVEALGKILEYKIANPWMTLSEDILNEFCPGWSARLIYKDLLTNLRNAFAEPNCWIDFFIAYDPTDDMRKINVPIMLLYGEKDTQVPPKINIVPAKENIKNATIKVLPSLNHLLQHATTGEINEYAQIEETISPEALDLIVSFVSSLNQ